jgi:RNA polymerase sigma-70 factor (ECF subfamily)
MAKTGDYQLGQEICQQVFCVYYAHMDEIDDDLVKAWLLKCTQNAIVDHLRKNGIRKEITLVSDYHETGNTLAEMDPDYCEKTVINNEFAGRILKEVRAVNESWYEVLVMICVDGMTHKQAAELLHVSEPVLRARLYRARSYVREKFGDEYWDD